MKHIIPSLLFIFFLASCCKEYHCVRGSGVKIVLVNYNQIDRDSARLYFYLKNNAFNTVLESRQKPYLFEDSSTFFTLPSFQYDYALVIYNDTFFVSELAEKNTIFKSCFGAVPKMSECELMDIRQIKGKNMTIEGKTITISK